MLACTQYIPNMLTRANVNKTKALPVLKHQQGATKGFRLKLVSDRYTFTLEQKPERASEMPVLSR
jgi:hypothetical protein